MKELSLYRTHKTASAYNKLALEFFKEFACLNRNERGEIL